jgi:Calcineurin-like phosphoesterase
MLISYFESGSIVGGIGIPEPIVWWYTFPKIGNPGIVNPAQSNEIKNLIRGTFGHLKKSIFNQIVWYKPQFFEEVFKNKIVLKPVSKEHKVNYLLLVPEINVEPVTSSSGEDEVNIIISFKPTASDSLQDRKLYNIASRTGNDFVVLAPHAIYSKENWDNFGIVHVTDIHVSRRLEYAKDDLKRSYEEKPGEFCQVDSPSYFNNNNNNFRDFISYVNSLHKNGSVDCIMATGDLVDYIFDSGEPTARTPRDPSQVNRINGNNFEFFKRMILGLEHGRDRTKNEELLVPVFTSLGNHDYRDMPYCWIGVMDYVLGKKNLNTYENTNLTRAEVQGLEGGIPEYGAINASKMVHFDENLPQYSSMINDLKNYIIKLGPHRIVMLDSGHDLAVPQFTSISDATEAMSQMLAYKLGLDSDDSKRFFGMSVNCVGVQREHIPLIKEVLAEAGSGVVILGIHAPLIDLGFYPYYLREMDRVSSDETVMRRGFPYFSPFYSVHGDYNGTGKQEFWPMTGTAYFKFGGVDFTLGDGVSKGLYQEFLEICTGIGVSRKVDLVLSDHGHKNVEFRLGFEPDKKLLFYHDYYTENPARYYAMKLLSESDFDNFIEENRRAMSDPRTAPLNRPLVFARYQDKMKFYSTIPREGLSQPMFTDRDHRFFNEAVEVPVNPTPLNKTADKIGWWTNHRPLIIQTAALGPLETINAGAIQIMPRRLSSYGLFQGCRNIMVKNNTISSIETVKMGEIRGRRPRLCSLKELVKARGIPFPASIRSLAEEISLIPPISQRLKKL